MAKQAIKKGDQHTDAEGGVYTVQSLNIKEQAVAYTYEKAGAGVMTDHMPVAAWKALTNPSNGTDIAHPELSEVHTPQVLRIQKGLQFQMTDRSEWKILKVSKGVLTIMNTRTEAEQQLPENEFTELVDTGHFKVL